MDKFSKTLAICLIATLGACGGGGGGGGNDAGGGGNPPVPNARIEGAWEGAASNGNTLRLIALEDSTFWGIFGTMAGDTMLVSGFNKGTGQSTGTQYNGNLREFDASGNSYAGTFSATVIDGTSVVGSTSANTGGSATFSLAPIPAAQFDYQRAANLSDVAGFWNGQFLNGNTGAISITNTGLLNGSSVGCSFSGSIIPRSSGKNVFNFSVTFGGGNCLLPGQTMTGIALVYRTTGGTTQLIAGGIDSSGTLGQMFLAQR